MMKVEKKRLKEKIVCAATMKKWNSSTIMTWTFFLNK